MVTELGKILMYGEPKEIEKIVQAMQLREEGETILSEAEASIVSLLSKKSEK